MNKLKIKPDLFIFAQELQGVVRDSNPIEQGKAFRRGRGYWLSNRTLAGMGGCSESHVRNMLELLDLPLPFQLRIANGEPYRQYLIRPKDSMSADGGNSSIQAEAQRGCEALRIWCGRLELAAGYAERVLKEVKLRIKRAEDARVISNSDVLWRGTPDEAFEAFRQPNYMQLSGFKQINAASDWLARALVYLMPSSAAREKALDIALMDASGYATR